MSPAEIDSHLTRLHLEAERLAEFVDVPADLRLRKSDPDEDGCWLELYWREAMDGDDSDGYYLALMRREGEEVFEEGEVGLEYESEILFAFFYSATHQLVGRQKCESSGEDPRRRLFAAQQNLMAQLNPDWAASTKQRHQLILGQSPFRDIST